MTDYPTDKVTRVEVIDGLMIDLSRKTEPNLESIKEIADYLEAL